MSHAATGNTARVLRIAEALADALIARGLGPTTNPELCMPRGTKALEPARGIYQRLNLAVLNFTRMTAILLKSGMIVNRDEELAVSSEAHHELVAAGIVEILRSCAAAARLTLANRRRGSSFRLGGAQ